MGLAEKILLPDEYIKQVTKLQFLRPITHDVIIYVYDQSTKPISRRIKDTSTTGLLETSNGRILRFDIVENIKSPISEYRGRNPIGDTLLMTEVRDGICYTFLDEKVRGKYEKALTNFVPLRTSTTLEILTRIATHVFYETVYPAIQDSMRGSTSIEKMITKVTNMPTDVDFFSFIIPNGIEARAQLDKSRKSSSGLEMFPIEFHFSPSQEPCVLYLAYRVE